jgi:hypothetical protein
VKPWYKYPEGRSRLARDRIVAAYYCPKLSYGPLVGKVNLRGEIDIEAGPSGIVRSIGTHVQFDETYPRKAPSAFVRRGQFEPQNASRHFRGDRSCCLWFGRAEDGWDPADPHAFEHFLQQLLVFFDRQLTFDAIGEFPGAVWVHDRPIAEAYLEERLGGDTGLVRAFKEFRRGATIGGDVACPCRCGQRFADCHEVDFIDLRQRLRGLEFDVDDLRELKKKRDE